jgi:hypothetical protein
VSNGYLQKSHSLCIFFSPSQLEILSKSKFSSFDFLLTFIELFNTSMYNFILLNALINESLTSFNYTFLSYAYTISLGFLY